MCKCTARHLLQVPPSEAEAKGQMKKVIKGFLSVLHPDKHTGRGSGEQDDQKVAVMTEVTAYLNSIYYFFKTE